MKKLFGVLVLLMMFVALPAFAGSNGLVSYAVGTNVVSSLTASNYDSTKTAIKCVCGPVETNSIRATWSPVATNPTSTIGHLYAVGTVINLEKSLTYNSGNLKTTLRDEVSNFRMISSSTTTAAAVPCTCD